LKNHATISSLGKLEEIILPNYMTSLSEEEILVIKKKLRKDVAIACGYHHASRRIVILNEDSNVLELIPELFFGINITIQHVIPIRSGSKIEITTSNTIIEIDSKDAISASKSVDISNLEIDMIYENNTV
jgi:hypothetical protein